MNSLWVKVVVVYEIWSLLQIYAIIMEFTPNLRGQIYVTFY